MPENRHNLPVFHNLKFYPRNRFKKNKYDSHILPQIPYKTVPQPSKSINPASHKRENKIRNNI